MSLKTDHPAAEKSRRFFLLLHPLNRSIISILLVGAVFFCVKNSGLNRLLLITLLWCVFALCYMVMSGIIFRMFTPQEIRRWASREDGSRIFVFILVVLSSFAAMFTVLLLILSKDASQTMQVYLPVAIAGIVLSWSMVHTTFTFHYAHLYYDDDKDNPKVHAEGLDFPEDEQPDYLDFAYYSFVIGMTFQVSDISITSKHIRRVTLLHSLLSFVLNTFVVALTINLIAGLK